METGKEMWLCYSLLHTLSLQVYLISKMLQLHILKKKKIAASALQIYKISFMFYQVRQLLHDEPDNSEYIDMEKELAEVTFCTCLWFSSFYSNGFLFEKTSFKMFS